MKQQRKFPPRETPGAMSLEDIRARCSVCEDTGCWIWQGAFRGRGPVARVGNSTVTVRKHIMETLGGAPLNDRLPTNTCGEALCVAPDHLVALTVSELRHQTFARETLAKQLVRRAKAAWSARSRSKLTQPDVDEIMASPDPDQELADRFGVSRGHIRRIRTGQAWKSYSNNPWAGLALKDQR